MSKKDFNPLEWKDKKEKSLNPNPDISAPIPAHSPYLTHKTYSVEDEIEALTSAVESASVDIAPTYSDWLDMAFALSLGTD